MSFGALVVPVLILLSSGPVWADQLADQNLPRACIQDGCLRGSWMKSMSGKWFEAFFGIPFAKPPIGELRFANPVPNDRWVEKELDATGRFQKPPCVQLNVFLTGQGVEGNEDCLYLNVYRPASKNESTKNATASVKIPTVVYIYGGAYLAGYNSPQLAGAEKLMDHPVILVSITYRVGAFGFLSTGDEAASGNFGLKDQRLALRWVHRNIRSFGGDPQLVTILGYSSGGASVQLQMMHLANEGLFQRAISMSGSALAPWSTPQPNPEQLARQQATLVGIKDAKTMSSRKLIKALRSVDADFLANSITGFMNGSHFPPLVYGPIVEKATVKDAFLTETPQKLWAQGAYLPVPLLTGILPNDGFAFAAPLLNSPPRTCLSKASCQLDTILQHILRGTDNPNALSLLKERFFGNTPEFGEYLTTENIDSLMKLFHEADFYYPLIQSVKQHLQNKKGPSSPRAPIYLYKFNYKGQFSFSSVYVQGDNATLSRDFGIVHGDDLLYIFRPAALFPDFQPGSPDAQVSQRLPKFIVYFSRTGRLKRKTNDSGTNADVFPLALEFFNTENQQDALGLRHTNIYDKDTFHFWARFYSYNGIYNIFSFGS